MSANSMIASTNATTYQKPRSTSEALLPFMKRRSTQAPKYPAGMVRKSSTARAIAAILAVFFLCSPLAAQGILNPEGRLQFFTNAGAVCASCTLSFFQAGTSTPQNVFSDSGLTTPVANPLTLDSAGRPTTGLYFSAVSYKIVLKDSGGSTIWTADNVPGGYSASIIVAGSFSASRLGSGSPTASTLLYGDGVWRAGDYATCDLRLTLESGNPYSTTDQTAKTNVFVTPLKGGRCGFYDGAAAWTVLVNAEVTISVPATTNTLYDVWCRNNAGTIACDTTAWTNDTTRATALAQQNAIYVKSGDTTRRYIGTFRTTGVSGQTEDSLAKRYVWSYYDRVRRALRGPNETADTWTYTTAAFRQANNNTANQLDVVVGVAEVEIDVHVLGAAANSTGAVNVGVAVGEDSTTTAATGFLAPLTQGSANVIVTLQAALRKAPAVGRHFYAWLEVSAATGTTTWQGDSGNAPIFQTGILGTIEG